MLRVDRTGGIAVVSAICAPILVMIVGFVADFGYASYINQCLARATDDATVGAVSQTAATAAGGYGNISYLQNTGTNYFNANVAQLGITGATFSLSVVADGNGGVIATGSYSYKVPTFFAGILGFSNIPVSGIAKTSAKPVTYVNYYILVDTSQSMGIASTQAGMNALWNAVIAAKNQSNGDPSCVFGCHVLQGGQTVTNEYLAHKNGIELRIDAAVTAIKSIITQAQNVAGSTKNIKFGLFAIQQDPKTNQNLHVVATLSNDYGSLQASASTIELGDNNSYGVGDTDITNELVAFNTYLTTSPSNVVANGSGASATSPVNYFLLVTDGLTDVRGGSPTTHITAPVNPSSCLPLKSKGTVAVIYTTNQPIWANNNPSAGVYQGDYKALVYDPWMKSYDSIKSNLQSCASSSDFFFEASDGPDIIAQMQALFAKTQPSSARITQ